ncbi:alpha/beta hydrolase [bacterium]|nr:alpha/beta hydrolase [bacterium]RQV93756.1 MAG: alpha/beta hydrolase [bacterium]
MPIKSNDISDCIHPEATYEIKIISVSDNVSLRVIQLSPAMDRGQPVVVFIAGWISLISAWKNVLKEITKDHTVYYVETREKISSQVQGKTTYSIEAIGRDIVHLTSQLNLKERKYILFGSSLGATAILDCCRSLTMAPLCLILVGPNAHFRVPKIGMVVVRIFPPRLYLLLKPYIKWYLKTFRLDIKSDYAQYEKYGRYLDSADPWKLKKAALAFSKYTVWEVLKTIKYPTLIIGASKDILHEPANLQQMVQTMANATYVDLETNKRTHSEEVVKVTKRYIHHVQEMNRK